MTEREKLKGLFQTAEDMRKEGGSIDDSVDFLIENGVTISPVDIAEQRLDDLKNPLNPIKVAAALQSEIKKLEIRKMLKPNDISILDYTIIACLKKQLENTKDE